MPVKTVVSPSDIQASLPGREVRTLVTAYQQTVAVATIGGAQIDRKYRLRGFSTRVGVCGSATATTVVLHKNTVLVTGASLTTDNADPDGTVKQIGLDVALDPGDQLEIVVTAAPTAGTDLSVTAVLVEDFGS